VSSIAKKQPFDFSAIRASNRLAGIAGRSIKLKKQGSEYSGLCPFHPDKKPSFTIYEGDDGTERYKCFACGANGDVIDFVAGIENIDTAEAARLLQGDKPMKPSKQTKPPASRPAQWDCIVPAPDDAPDYYLAKTYSPSQQKWKIYSKGRVDTYRDAEGRKLCHVVRLALSENDKACITVTYCENSKGERRWCTKRMPAPYPLMGLDELAARPNAHVLLVSGEKCKVAASPRISYFVVMTTMGGDGAVLKNDLSPLYGRNIVLWSDADKSGIDSMHLAGEHLAANGCEIRHIDTTGFPEKYDVADLLETDISDADLKDELKARVRDGNLPKPPTQIPKAKKPRKSRQKAAQREPEPEPEPAEPPAAAAGTGTDPHGSIALGDFQAHMPDHRYIFKPTRDLWPGPSVDARLEWPQDSSGTKTKPTKWLDKNAAVEQMTWAPGLPMLIRNKLVDTGGWINRKGCTCFNLYRPPTLEHGDADQAGLWIDHVRKVYPREADHILKWLAQRVQNPQEKINHAMVLGGKPGVGKDTLLEPAKQAVGPWNCQEVAPGAMLGRFNGFVKSVMLRVSEARDLGDIDRYTFYEHMKAIVAAPPDVIRVDEKHLREYPVPNVCGVLITTNHKTNGLYLPEDDRRHYVAWSELPENPFDESYWDRLWQWYYQGGFGHVAAYLAQFDISGFNPKAPPKKTEAFWHMVNSNRAPEDAELADVLDRLRWPAVITLDAIREKATQESYHDFAEWLRERKNRRKIPHRLEAAGYEPVRNQNVKDGLWKVGGKRQMAYAKTELSIRDRIIAAEKLT